MATNIDPKIFLHVGCGPLTKKALRGFDSDEWDELRFDIDPGVNPDIQGTLTDMGLVDDGCIDALFSSHNIEHLYPHEIGIALGEFKRVLKPSGFVVLTCPDLQSVCASIVADRLDEPLYISPAGPICPIDILYGHRPSMLAGNLFMAHRTGFTRSTLTNAFAQAGFGNVLCSGRPDEFSLWLIAYKENASDIQIRADAAVYLPPHAV